MKSAFIILPNQLFKDAQIIEKESVIFLVEESLFFKQYNFHKQKLAFHRATMRFYMDYLIEKGFDVKYIDSNDEKSDIRKLIGSLKELEISNITTYFPEDNWLEKRVRESCSQFNLDILFINNPLFINSIAEIEEYFIGSNKKFYQTDFYIFSRKRHNILIDNNKPLGGKWSFDSDNRKKYPKDKLAPELVFPKSNKYTEEAIDYVNKHFKNNLGELNANTFYPISFEESENWFNQFLIQRFEEFGDYEDAIIREELYLNHSVLTPMLNVGLLSPKYLVQSSIDYALKYDIKINSLEGFVRQILGWREFIRAVYHIKGSEERTKNFWGFKRKIPDSFYSANTRIIPIDATIEKLKTGAYCHHIERLMILGNFMLLCEFDPDEVYRWFMEFFIDSYDWVMVPNVYGMSQFADGGLMSTKPYISGSNYILKMSNYKRGDWADIWDALFWRFMNVHREFFLSNPRLGMLVRTYDKMSQEKKALLMNRAEAYLKTLD